MKIPGQISTEIYRFSYVGVEAARSEVARRPCEKARRSAGPVIGAKKKGAEWPKPLRPEWGYSAAMA